ncbi:MAG: hypothetical protein IEMM0002_0300 [bacterium]|nr:MAG: hypothetical protein IEMM0002_0300 [bacterium]
MNHLSNEQLLGVMENSKNSASAASAHFNECGECLKRAEAIKNFQIAAGGTAFILPAQKTQKTRQCPDTDELSRFFEETQPRCDEIKKHLGACDRCFDHASYYFAESSLMRGAKEPATPPRYRAAALALVQKKKTQRAVPYWAKRWVLAPMPAYAVAVLLWLGFFFNASVPAISILSQAPTYSIYKKEMGKMPLFHFGQHGEKISTRPAEMKLSATRHKLLFEWESVEGISAYYFILQEIEGGVPRTIKQLKTRSPSVTLPRELFRSSVVYRWITAGSIPPEKYFDGRLEFSIN